MEIIFIIMITIVVYVITMTSILYIARKLIEWYHNGMWKGRIDE